MSPDTLSRTQGSPSTLGGIPVIPGIPNTPSPPLAGAVHPVPARPLVTVSPSPSPEEVELELRLARFEQLMARRPLLLNSVLLRQNPHNVHEWHKRVQLYQGRPEQVGTPPGGGAAGGWGMLD